MEKIKNWQMKFTHQTAHPVSFSSKSMHDTLGDRTTLKIYLKKSFLLSSNCFIFGNDWHFLCFRLTFTQLPVQLDDQILGWAYTRVQSQFWYLPKTWEWDFTRRWEYTCVSTVCTYDMHQNCYNFIIVFATMLMSKWLDGWYQTHNFCLHS